VIEHVLPFNQVQKTCRVITGLAVLKPGQFFSAQNSLGADPFGAPGLFEGAAPYWRMAIEPHWARHGFRVNAHLSCSSSSK
jgi:hypothetical protein